MAMLFPAYVYEWDTKHPGKRLGVAYGDYWVFNPNRFVDIRDRSYAADSTSSISLYSNDPDDRRDSPDTLGIGSAPSVIQAWYDLDPPSKFGTLYIFPDMDITQTSVATTIEWANIAYLWQTPKDYADGIICRMVYYPEAWKRVECIIDASLVEVWFYHIFGAWA